MLDKNDLQSIKEVIDVSIEAALDVALTPIKNDVSELKNDVSSLKQDMVFVKQELTSIRTEMGQFRNDLARVEAKIDRLIKMESEDVIALNNDVQILKKKHEELEKQLKILQEQRVS